MRRNLIERIRPFYEGLRALPGFFREGLSVRVSFGYDEYLEPTNDWRFEQYYRNTVPSYQFLEALFNPSTSGHRLYLNECSRHTAPEETNEEDDRG